MADLYNLILALTIVSGAFFAGFTGQCNTGDTLAQCISLRYDLFVIVNSHLWRCDKGDTLAHYISLRYW
jgi:hypothetical protein